MGRTAYHLFDAPQQIGYIERGRAVRRGRQENTQLARPIIPPTLDDPFYALYERASVFAT